LFDLLKKKIQGFTKKLTEKAREREATVSASEETKKQEGKKAVGAAGAAEEKEALVEEKGVEKRAKGIEGKIEKKLVEKGETAGEEKITGKEIEKGKIETKPIEKENEKGIAGEPAEEKPVEAEEEVEGKAVAEKAAREKPGETAEAPVEEEKAVCQPAEAEAEPVPIEKPVEEKRAIKPSVSIRGRLKAVVSGAIELEAKDLKELLWELELALLEADVEQTTAEEITSEIKRRLVGKKIGRKENLEEVVKKEIKEILLQMMQTEQRDLLKEVKQKKDKPYKVLFLGPNGAGKTTTIAKLTYFLQNRGLRVIWAAGDTFRAASIEQLEKHATKLGVRVVKHQYGADPAAVAFDAVKAAQSKKVECVLIDSAGRQETNRNLMRELQKIVRVIKPDLKVYVGEAFTGQALLQQAREYDKDIGIDAFVLTKIDCDSKGGTTISLLFKLKKPILFVGTGQEYKDLSKFKPEFVVERAVG